MMKKSVSIFFATALVMVFSIIAFGADMSMAEISLGMNSLWVLVAAALVFLMQAGFAMVEAGFTRAKNASNIIMKNIMDFSVGSFLFFAIGFSLMFGDSISGFIGWSGFFNPDKMNYDSGLYLPVFILFQTVFAGTAATIVSGAMAERTKFKSYLIFSAVITMIIYPVVGHWTWGGGWLSKLDFVDFAGSTVVHSVGGWAALMGAFILGPRLGKYDKNGKANNIPGHSITLGALGVFILWFGWFGFNAGSELGVTPAIGHIAMTTNLAAAVAATAAMFAAWVRHGKPSVGYTLNGALGGLVAITAGTASVSIWGAIAIGAMAGVVVTYGMDFVENVLKVDDPVGAVTVHGICGAFGTVAVGFFHMDRGLFYGGDAKLLGVQALGVVAVAFWTLALSFILFSAIKYTMGLRVSEEDEMMGLDRGEHDTDAYSDLMPLVQSAYEQLEGNQKTSLQK